MLEFRPFVFEDLEYIVTLDLTPIDKEENFITTRLPDDEVLMKTIVLTDELGGEVIVIEEDGKIEGVCGILNENSDGIVWMLTTKTFSNDALSFFRQSKKLLNRWDKEYLLMFNYILAERTEGIRFLKLLGFKVDEEYPQFTEEGVKLYRFYRQGR